MFYVQNNRIYITRGDDASIECSLTTDDGSRYPVQADDVIALTVRERPQAESLALLRVDGAPGTARIVLRGADTADIDPGRYSADLQLTTGDGKRYTFWPELEGMSRYMVKNFANFVIMPEVTV